MNVSPQQLLDGLLESDVDCALELSGLSPDRLVLEVTESTLVHHDPAVFAALQRLRGRGVRIALDDFGTGYAALSSLRNLPVDRLKIDRSFVTGMHRGPREAALATAVVSLATSLGLDVVAEGVEEPGEALSLRALGCSLAQGFLWSKAVPGLVLEQLMADGLPREPASGRARPRTVRQRSGGRQTPATPSRT